MYSQEFDVTFQALPPPPVASTTALRFEENEISTLAPISEGSADPLAVFEQSLEIAFHVNVDALVHRMLLQRADHFETRAIADVGQPRVSMAAKIALQNQPFLCPIKKRAPLLEFKHAVRGFLRVDLRHSPVVQKLSPAHGVAKMNFPVVFRIDVSHRSSDAAFRHDGMGFAQKRLADQSGAGTLRRSFNRRPQPGAARANHNNVVFVCLVFFLSH